MRKIATCLLALCLITVVAFSGAASAVSTDDDAQQRDCEKPVDGNCDGGGRFCNLYIWTPLGALCFQGTPATG